MKSSARLVKQAINDSNPPNFHYDSSASKKHKDDIDRIQQDLNVLNQKIAEARGESSSVHATSVHLAGNESKGGASPFVSGLRTLAESERSVPGKDVKDLKISTLESLLEKISEYDRLILAKTVPAETSTSGQPLRRKSFGTDLNVLPNHLRVVDRLVDLHNSNKRVTVLRQTVTPPTTTASQPEIPAVNPHYTPTTHQMSSPVKATNNNNNSNNNNNNNSAEINELKSTINKLNLKLELLETKRMEKENQNEFLSKDKDTLQKKNDSLQQTLQQKETELQNLQKAHKSLENDLHTLQQSNNHSSSSLQEKLEIEISYNQRILSILMNKINFLQNDNLSLLSADNSNLLISNQQYQNMVSFLQNCLLLLFVSNNCFFLFSNSPNNIRRPYNYSIKPLNTGLQAIKMKFS
jgi:DNA repair exonuclease SbcCD ATPase subunit